LDVKGLNEPTSVATTGTRPRGGLAITAARRRDADDVSAKNKTAPATIREG
jgi:hypothetical protein